MIGDVVIPVEIAVTAEERRQGLSDRESLQSGAGMLFVYESAGPLQFWMVRMQFSLDFVWIGEDCAIGEISRDIPPPPPGSDDWEVVRVSPSGEMQFVLEINGGEAEELGLEVGNEVLLAGSIEGMYGC